MIIRLMYEPGVIRPGPGGDIVNTSTFVWLMSSKYSHPEFRGLTSDQKTALVKTALEGFVSVGRVERMPGANHWSGDGWRMRGLLDQIAWAARD